MPGRPTSEDFKEARRLAGELKQRLPARFYPHLHFIADEEIPVFYCADVDRDFVMGYREGHAEHLKSNGTTENVPAHMIDGGDVRREFIHEGRHYELQGFFPPPAVQEAEQPRRGFWRSLYEALVGASYPRHP